VATNKAETEINVGPFPFGVAITPDGKTAYVTNNNASVTPIEVATNKPGPEIKVGRRPFVVAITPDGTPAYVTNVRSQSVTPIEVGTNKPGPEIEVGFFPIEVAITPKPLLPTSKDECKKGGWTNFGSTFKNQGACVNFVATGGHSD